jgi:hypothetical protein
MVVRRHNDRPVVRRHFEDHVVSATVIKLYPQRHTPVTRQEIKSVYDQIAETIQARAKQWYDLGHEDKAHDLLDAAALVRRVAMAIELGD